MPFVPVPGDLDMVKTRLAFGLTKRQLFCFIPAIVLGGGTYFLTRNVIGNDFAMMLMLIIALPLFMLGIYEKDGRPLEKVMLDVIRVKFLFPSIRPYRTHNLYQEVDDLVRNDIKENCRAKKSNEGKKQKKAASKSKIAATRREKAKRKKK